MKIFLIGPTKSWKTTAAQLFERQYGYIHIPISQELTAQFPQYNHDSFTTYKKRLTTQSLEIVNNNPDFFISSVQKKISNQAIYVIEWVRNPRDFIFLFDTKIDVVIQFNGTSITEFESQWIKAIAQYCTFMKLYQKRDFFYQRKKDPIKSAYENFIFNTQNNEYINFTNTMFC